jgi:hypothetical protein
MRFSPCSQIRPDLTWQQGLRRLEKLSIGLLTWRARARTRSLL